MPNALLANSNSIAHFHCPNTLCSAVACLADVQFTVVKLICPLGHAYWLPIVELSRVEPYWPSEDKQ